MARVPNAVVLCLVYGCLAGSFATGAVVAQTGAGDGMRVREASPTKRALQAVVADREAIIQEVLANEARFESRHFGDDEELAIKLHTIGDGRLAAALLATSGEEFERAILGRTRSEKSERAVAKRQRFLGNSSADLVFTPIAACSLFDTRTDARGPMAANETRAFAVQGTLISNQGGNAADCPQVPFDPPAVVVQLRVVEPQGIGQATAWAFAQVKPSSSSLLFQNGVKVADGLMNDYLVSETQLIVPVCQNCGSQNDISIAVDMAQAQVVGSIVGFFEHPQGCQAGTTEIAGHCFQTSLRSAANLFTATNDCEDEGGRLPSAGEILLALNTLTGTAAGEHTSSIYNADINNTANGFRDLRITSAGTLVSKFTLDFDQYRCVFDLFQFN